MTTQTAIMKLINGETIVCKISSVTDGLVTVEDPLLLTFRPKENGAASLVATKWMETDETQFPIKRWHIVGYARPSHYIAKVYEDSMNDLDEYSDYEDHEHDGWEDEIHIARYAHTEDDVTH